jgi:hypothetical protein
VCLCGSVMIIQEANRKWSQVCISRDSRPFGGALGLGLRLVEPSGGSVEYRKTPGCSSLVTGGGLVDQRTVGCLAGAEWRLEHWGTHGLVDMVILSFWHRPVCILCPHIHLAMFLSWSIGAF